MLLHLLRKDFKLLLNDLRIQIFSAITLIMFLLSAFSFVSIMKEQQESFFNRIKLANERMKPYSENTMRLISEASFSYYQPPMVEDIFLSRKGFPTRFSSEFTAFSPRVSNFTQQNKQNMSLNWLFIIGVIQSFAALLFSYDAISREKADGTLRLKVVGGVSRISILISKYLSLLFLFCVTNFLGFLISSTILILFFGIIAKVLFTGVVGLFVISIFFLSFFIFSGLLISMSRNIRNNIVVALSFWLLFIFIIPNIAVIVGETLYPLPSNKELGEQSMKISMDSWNQWTSKYDNHESGINKVGGNGFLAEGYRAAAVYERSVLRGKLKKETLLDSAKQIKLVESISQISPYSVISTIMESLLDIGLNRFHNELEQFAEKHSQIINKIKDFDNSDERSLHLFYIWAYSDLGAVADQNIVPFTDKPYPNPNELIVTDYEKEKLSDRIIKVLPGIGILLLLNFIIFSLCYIKSYRLDIR